MKSGRAGFRAIERPRNLLQRRERDRVVEETRVGKTLKTDVPTTLATAVHLPPLKSNAQRSYNHPC